MASMKFASTILCAAGVTGQLLGFGTSCPILDLTYQNLEETEWFGQILVVAHNPDLHLVNINEPTTANSPADLKTLISTKVLFDEAGDDASSIAGLAGFQSTIEQPEVARKICGSVVTGPAGGQTIEIASREHTRDSTTGQLETSNAAHCSCGDMVITAVGGVGMFTSIDAGTTFIGAGSFTMLHEHRLESTTEVSYARSTLWNAGMISDATGGKDAAGWIMRFTLDAEVGQNNEQGLESALWKFEPVTSNSASLLVLWSLLMGGWW